MKNIACVILILILWIAQSATAASILEQIRDTDLNDYALGLAISVEESVYKGQNNSTIMYPYLTSMRDHAFTDDWLVVGEGDLGFRLFTDNGWVLGAVGRFQTESLSENSELPGIDQRQWSVELAPTIGFRKWPVHFALKSYFELLDRHNGTSTHFTMSYPRENSQGYLVPELGLTHLSQNYADYYYGISVVESTTDRAAYEADAAVNVALKLRWGFAISEKWVLKGQLGYEFLDQEISDSFLVNKDSRWSANIGLAYNANVFQAKSLTTNGPIPRLQLKFSTMADQIDTGLVHDAVMGQPGSEVDIESLLGLSERETVSQFDVMYRIANYHRISFNFSQWDRSGSEILGQDIQFGDETFTAGSTVFSDIDTSIWRLEYGYSLLLDSQKEVGLSAGIHQTSIDAELFEPVTGRRATSEAIPTLPVIGAFGSVALGERTTLMADAHIFRLDTDRYEGRLNSVRIELQYRLGNIGLGIGYSYYAMRLDSSHDDLRGSLKFRHRGPTLSATILF